MRTLFIAVPALLYAGGAVADDRPNPLDPKVKAPPVEFRSAFEGYRPFSDSELRDWRKSNEEVGAAGAKPSPQTSKPQPRKPETSGGHGGHK